MSHGNECTTLGFFHVCIDEFDEVYRFALLDLDLLIIFFDTFFSGSFFFGEEYELSFAKVSSALRELYSYTFVQLILC